jgi:N-acetylglucosaminyl-diphospho-decaprenol L-rhamnosyltransferase
MIADATRVPTVAIVIVNWNAGDQLGACVASIESADQKAWRLSCVTVVDNASLDGSVEGLSSCGPCVQVVRNSANRGFAAACNQGARLVTADYLLFLNPDTRLDAGSLDAAVSALEHPANHGVAVAGIQLYEEAGEVARSCARFPTVRSMLIAALGLPRAGLGRGFAMIEWAHDETRAVDHVIGAFYLVRAAVFRDLGGFDERFFVYLEDVDFSLRAHQAGWRTLYLADARAFHRGGGTSAAVPAQRLAYSVKSRLAYARKHFSRSGVLVVGLGILLAEPVIRLSRAAARLSAADARAIVGAYRLVWTGQIP